MTSKRRPKARARTFHRLGGALVVGASAAAVVIVPELRNAEATPPKALHAPSQPDLAPSPFPAPLGSMPPAPPLSMRAPLAAPAPRAHVPHVSRDEGSGCGKTFRSPFDGSLALRSAYRSAKPHSYMFCPTWSSFGPVRGGHRFHGGIDVSAPTGTPVRAATDGTLTYARDPGGYGLFARVRFPHPKRGRDGTCGGSGEVEIIYAHLQEDSGKVSAPARHVRAGEIIGKVGCTGNAKGMCSPSPESHLHVTVQRTDGARARIDPPAFLGWHVRTPEDGDKAAEWAACGGGAPLFRTARRFAWIGTFPFLPVQGLCPGGPGRGDLGLRPSAPSALPLTPPGHLQWALCSWRCETRTSASLNGRAWRLAEGVHAGFKV